MPYRRSPRPPAREHRVLVVEGDHRLCRLMIGALVELGYHVIEAPDALMALEVLRDGPPIELVVTDPRSTGVNGCLLGWAVRRHHGDMPILVTSSGETPPVMPPRTTFLTRPFTMAELVTAVCRLLPIPECETRRP